MGQTMRTENDPNLPATAPESWNAGWREPVRSANWVGRFPWLTQASTGRAPDLRVHGLGGPGVAGGEPSPADAWRRLAHVEGFADVVLTRQVHGNRVLVHGPEREPGTDPLSSDGRPVDADGHVTQRPGVLLAVTVADCVPVFLVDPRTRSVGMLHAGWRGASAGILAGGIEAMGERFGARAEDVHVHLGPAICGSCYEVGPEVHDALGLPIPQIPTPVDVAAVLERQAISCGLRPASISRDPYCTLERSDFYSHRGGDAGRQVGYIGIRASSGAG